MACASCNRESAGGRGGLCLTLEGRPIACRLQTHQAMCRACPSGRQQGAWCAGWRGAPAMATKERIDRGMCPRGRAPDKRGRVRWMGLVWFGVPMPIRLWLMARAVIPHLKHTAGCGCLVWLKRDVGVRARWWWRGVRRRWVDKGRVAKIVAGSLLGREWVV